MLQLGKIGLLFTLIAQSCMQTPSPVWQAPPMRLDGIAAPDAPQHPKTLEGPDGDRRDDPYYWLNERDNPEVIAYLEAENRYCDSVMAPLAKLRQTLYDELKARIQEDDSSVPVLRKGYEYYTRFEGGKEYPVYCRRKLQDINAGEEILLDVNQLAKDREYCSAYPVAFSPDNTKMAYIVDYTGRNLFQAYVRDLPSGKIIDGPFEVGISMAWANDNATLFYDTKDPVTLRNNKIWRRNTADLSRRADLVYEEKDETTYAYVGKTKSESFLLITSGYTETVEVRMLNADNPSGAFTLIKPREQDFFYDVQHQGDHLLIRTNWDAPNFRIMRAPIQAPGPDNWSAFVEHSNDVLIAGYDVYQDFVAISERREGLKTIRILHTDPAKSHGIDFGEPTYNADLFGLPDYASPMLRYVYSSPKTPQTTVDYDVNTRQKNVRKVAPVLGGFDSDNYVTELVFVTARDAARVPLSIMYRKGVKRDGSAPCFLTGYGAYGFSYDPAFNRDKISLADRGFVIAIAHVRGGMEMGYYWYRDGKMSRKMNTFNDFIDCSEYLVRERYTSANRLFAEGRSAGGLLMGAIANMRPDLYRGIIAGVPFVDVLT
ncbi:MAG: S9 family peptidase, partial [Saprospiraceae bacterium]